MMGSFWRFASIVLAIELGSEWVIEA